MKFPIRFLVAVGVVLSLGGLSEARAGEQDIAATNAQPAIVVGTFDSRAVATAYMRSNMYKEVIDALQREHREAKAAGNDQRVAELETEGPRMQHLGHQQVFGNAPIPNVLKVIENEFADVAAKSGVDIMVSKWRFAYEGPNAKFVDVTDPLVMLFEPDEETLGVIEQIKAIDPMPEEQLKSHVD